MSPDLITQVVADQPQLVIISANPNLPAALTKALGEWQFEVVVMKPSELNSDVFERAYKLIWLIDHELMTSVSDQKTALGRHQSKLYFFVPVVSPITDSGPVSAPWQQESYDQHQLVTSLSQWFPEASLILGQDVLLPNHSENVVIKVMTQAIGQHSLLDPEVTLYFQTWASFCKTAARFVIVPRQEKYIVQGKKTTTTALAKLLQLHLQRFTQQLLSLESIAVTQADLPVPEATIQLAADSFDIDKIAKDIASQIAQRLEHMVPQPAAEELPRPVRSRTRTRLPQSNAVGPIIPTPPGVSSPPSAIVTPPTISQPPGNVQRIPRVQIPLVRSMHAESVAAEKTAQPTRRPPGEMRPTSLRVTKSRTSVQTPDTKETIEDEVIRLFQDTRSEYSQERVRGVAKTTVKTTKKLVHKKKAFVGGLVFVSLGMIVVSLIAFFFVSTWQLQRSLVTSLAQSTSKMPTRATLFWSRVTLWQINAYTNILDPNYFATSVSAAELTASLPLIGEHKLALDKLAETSVLQAFGRKDGEIVETLSELNSTAQSLYEILSQNQAKLKTFPTDGLTPEQQRVIVEYQANLADAKRSLLPSQQLHSIMAQLLGKESKRTYVVVLQNNQELRPTGGFIQAVALVTFDQGMVIDTQVFNVYDLDSKITGATAPPVEITQLLGEKQWYLRDSNWHPDFPTTATQISQFVERSTGKKVDGVLALNLLVASDLLKVLGPIELPEYNEVITDRNLSERMEFHSEIQLAPNPEQPDYSTLFLNRLLQKISDVQADKIPALLAAVNHNFDQKQLLLSFQDSGELSTLSALGWTGALLQPSCPIQLSDVACQVDTIAQVEANIGINKANAYVDRVVHHSVDLSPTQADHHRQIVFTNTATSNAWPKGTYKSYVRLYVPITAQLKGVTIDGTPLPPTQTIVKDEQNRQIFSFLIDVPTQKSVTVMVDYTVPLTTASTPFSYTLFNQQQPGIEKSPITITIEPSIELKPTLIAPQATLKDQTIVFDKLTAPHAFVGIKF